MSDPSRRFQVYLSLFCNVTLCTAILDAIGLEDLADIQESTKGPKEN